MSAEYSFGKPVRGEVDIIASRYVGVWEEYASFTKEIDGETSFELPAPGYVAGTPAAAGQGNLLWRSRYENHQPVTSSRPVI